MRLALIISLAGLCACTAFPDLENRIDDATRAQGYPQLASLDPVLAQNRQDAALITPVTTAVIKARIAELRVKAQRLRGPVVDATSRARMLRGLT